MGEREGDFVRAYEGSPREIALVQYDDRPAGHPSTVYFRDLVAVDPSAPPEVRGNSENRFQTYSKRVIARAAQSAASSRFPVNALTFGVEVECYLPRRWYEDSGISIGGYSSPAMIDSANFPAYSWKVGTDGSLDSAPSGTLGLEFKTIPLAGPLGLKALVEGVRVLKSAGAKVNASCGLHIHVGIPDATRLDVVRRLVAMCARFERVLYATTGSVTRENNTSYCVPIRDKVKPTLEKRAWSRRDLVMAQQGNPYDENGDTVGNQRGYMGSSKYSSVNFQPLLDGRGTVEFRLFAGTLNVQKILGHLACSLGIVQKSLSNERSVHPDGWTPNIDTPQQSAAALMESWRSFQVSMGWIGANREAWGWNKPPEGFIAPTLKACRRKLTEKVKQYALARFGTTGSATAEDDADGQGE
jgi:hypothetical protein